jgi:hypothetical protein
MRPIHCIPILVLLGGLLTGCTGAIDPCDQFAPPVGKLPTECPTKPVTERPYRQAKYCYSSLAQVDCYAEPQPGRSGYLGSSN